MAVYVHNSLKATLLPYTNPLNLQVHLELILLKINSPTGNRVIGVYYRPPHCPESLTALYHTLLSFPPSALRHLTIFGDFNVNMLAPSHHLMPSMKLILDSFNLTQIVSEPTHFSHSGKESLIDLILTADPSLVSHSILPCIRNTDHSTIICSIHLPGPTQTHFTRKSKQIWCYEQADWAKATAIIEDTNWNQIIEASTIDSAWDSWKSIIKQIMIQCIPYKCITTRPSLPWITPKKIRKRNNYYRRSKSSSNSLYLQKYKSLRNQVTYDLRRAKESYLYSLCNSSSLTTASWRLVKSLSKSRISIPDLVVSGMVITNDVEKAEQLSSHFTKSFNPAVPPLVPSKINPMPHECPDNLCSPSEITEIICSWNSKMSAGPDDIPIQILKPLAPFIAPSLSALFNKSISECALPQEWKLANITPIPKSNRLSEVTNYRPISLLSVTSKICEKFISSILLDHLDDHNILSDSQWGFREGRSTCNALLDITHTWHCHLNDGKEVAIVFFDYAKAFDSIPHAPLLSVLSNIGLHHHIIQWLSAYLTNRRQQVMVNDSFSTPAHASSGVQSLVPYFLIFISMTSPNFNSALTQN